MDDALAVRLVERVGDLAGDGQGLVERQRALLEAHGQRLPVEERHHEVVGTAGVADVVEAAGMGMVKGGDSARFAFEAAATAAIAGDLANQDLDGDVAAEPRVTRAIHLAHAAGTQRGEHFVRAEACSRCEGHFRNRAGQLRTTVSGEANPSPVDVLTRKRWPSSLTT